jgi:hypothetical protein
MGITICGLGVVELVFQRGTLEYYSLERTFFGLG